MMPRKVVACGSVCSVGREGCRIAAREEKEEAWGRAAWGETLSRGSTEDEEGPGFLL